MGCGFLPMGRPASSRYPSLDLASRPPPQRGRLAAFDGDDVTKAEIREAVRVALAENGYSPGHYAWKRATLLIWSRKTMEALRLNQPEPEPEPEHRIHLPAGISRKRFIERLSVLPVAGPSRKAERRGKRQETQLEMYA